MRAPDVLSGFEALNKNSALTFSSKIAVVTEYSQHAFQHRAYQGPRHQRSAHQEHKDNWRLTCDVVPVVQGGMQWVGYAELASAVSNAGGLGIVRFHPRLYQAATNDEQS